jgi:Zinc finger, C3HC4 type (RING finger)
VLNRVTVYASTRQRIFLTWDKRLALRIVPILLLIVQIRSLLQAIQCQTSPDFSLYRYGDENKYNPLDWPSESSFLHTLSSTLAFSSDSASCDAIGMSRTGSVRPRYGSFSLLWPTFLRLSLSHLTETLSCALQQQHVMTEVGMSVFEHSLAFAETETMISQILGIGLFRSSAATAPLKAGNATAVSTTTSKAVSDMIRVPTSATNRAILDVASSLTGPHLLDRVNVPVEVLLVALLSSCNSLTANIIAVLNKQRSLRLLNTGFWGIGFMSAFVWGFWGVGVDYGRVSRTPTSGVSFTSVSGMLLFPTVCIVGFVPHLLVLVGITICTGIYILALLFTACSLDTNPLIQQPQRANIWTKLRLAHENLLATIQLRTVNIKWHEDFYTALLRVGFVALTAASEAVFFHEGRSVEARRFTWLEEEALDTIEASTPMIPGGARHAMIPSTFQISEEYGVPPGGSESQITWESGYAKERKLDKEKKRSMETDGAVIVYPQAAPDGVGAVQRSTRFYLLFIFIRGVYFLIGGWLAYGFGVLLDRLGVTGRPRWLRKVVGKSLKKEAIEKEKDASKKRSSVDFWLMGEPADSVTDDSDYTTSEELEDTTSVLSMSTTTSIDNPENEQSGWESESEGPPTPTQHNFSRESTPADFTPLDTTTLARLLNPPDKASRDEARILAAHLEEGDARIMTRSRYRQRIDAERSRVLLAGRSIAVDDGQRRPLTSDEEAVVLESLIISRRKDRVGSASTQNPSSQTEGANTSPGVVCVVCQSQARTIIAWPCRCLCVCEDCRVSLALNNFDKCVTCRREVIGFVRLWVP